MGLGQGLRRLGPCSAIHPVSVVGHPDKGEVWLQINGVLKQVGDLQDLIWPVAGVISHVSQAVALAPGDLIYSGTPEGVAAVGVGDVLEARVEGLAPLRVALVATA